MPDSKITIRLPETIAAKLSEVADAHKVTRTAILLDLLARGIDDWQPAQRRTAPSDVVRLEGAIEDLRLELAEAIERIGRLERQANAQRRPTVSAQPRPKAKQAETGRTLGEAAHAIKLTQKPTDRNYDLRCQRKHGMKLAEYLASEGWTQHDRRWFPPAPQP
jgi:hypothetical protein